MDPSAARATILQQHRVLRVLMADVRLLAQEVSRRPDLSREPIVTALAELAVALTDHNATEAELLTPLLAATDGFGDVRVSRMRSEHLAEHAALTAFFRYDLDGMLDQLDAFCERIIAHMEAEERTFLHPRVLRDDLVAVDHAGG